MVRADRAATETRSDEVDNLSSLSMLTDVELWDELPTGSRRLVPLDGLMERSLSVDVTRDVGIQPFLLIDRTRSVVTGHAATLAVVADMDS